MAIFDIPWLSESIKKRALRYLLQRYLGNFLLEKLTLDQLSLDLYEGRGTIRKIQLDVDTINDELNHLSRFRFIEGSIHELSVAIPWTALLVDASSIHFDGVSLNLCKFAANKSPDFPQSTLITKSLMTSSIQMAEEIVSEEQNEKFDGLEMFAQLIDSVLRRFKLSASNTSVKFVFPRKTGDGQQIEVRVRHMTCEEEEEVAADDGCGGGSGGEGDGKQRINIVSETITKNITLEGIEVLINSVLVCKLNGKHSIQLKVDEKATDLQIFFGSHVFSIINSKHLETLIELFECGEPLPAQMPPMSGEKLMSSEDYLKVEQQLQMESGCAKPPASAVISNAVTIGDKWTTCGFDEADDEEPKFMPITGGDREREPRYAANKAAKSSQFSCHLRIPGLTVCLIADDAMPRFEGMPIIDTQNSFARINSFLDKMLDSCDHLRFLSLQLSFDIASDGFSLSCGDLMVSEVLGNALTPILWNPNSTQTIVSPFMRFKAKDNKMSLNIDSMNLRIDLTFLERFNSYYNTDSRKSGSQTSLDFNLDIETNRLNVELLFPIPDLRPYDERTPSQLRDESLLLKLTNSAININANGGEIRCKCFGLDFKVDNDFVNIINGQSMNSEDIRLKARFGLNSALNTTLDEDEVNALFEADMEDSIYVGQTAPQQVTEPFQVKRKVIGRDANENEQVLTPGDREHMKTYFDTSVASSQIHLELFVPSVDIHFQNKEQLELLYNRIGNDLILWTPFAQQSSDATAGKEPTIAQNPTFFSIKTMSDSSSTNSSFHSFNGSPQANRLNFMTLGIHVNDVTLGMSSKEEVTQEIFAQNLMFGLVVSDKSEANSTLCLCAENMSFKSDGAVVISGNIYNEPNCAFNLAVDIKRENDSLKKIKIALQLSSAAMYEIPIPVFDQFWRFINLTDEVVIGYTPPKVITELHIDLLDSAVALETLGSRPALITFEDIYVTSMVVENTNETLLRIFAEDTLFCFKRNKSLIEAMKSYICVVETGIIDLNLKLAKDGKLEFKVSNNAIDIRVCADSFSALCHIISSLTSSSTNNNDIESTDPDNSVFEKTFDGKLMEDAMGDNEEVVMTSEDSDDELPPKFCTNCDSPQMDESGFWVLGADDLGTGIKMTAEPQIRFLTEDTITVIENHFNISRQRIIPDISPASLSRYFLEEMTLILHLYDGKDFDDDLPSDSPIDKRTDDTKSYKSYKSNKTYHSNEPRVRFTDGSVHMWENIDLESAHLPLRGAHSNHNARASNSFKSMGGLKRQNDTCVSICLNKVKTLFENFEPEFPLSWRFVFMVQDFEIIDKVIASKIKKMLYEYYSESMPRRKHVNMISIRATAFKNVDNKEECELKVSVKPLRVNIDQDTLLFIGTFFTTVIETMSSEDTQITLNTMVDETLPSFSDTCSNASEMTTKTVASTVSTNTVVMRNNDDANKLYFRLLSFSPDVPISLDYHGKHVDFDRVIHSLVYECIDCLLMACVVCIIS
jgi:hypothetical protein